MGFLEVILLAGLFLFLLLFLLEIVLLQHPGRVLFRRYLRWFDQVREDAYEAVAVNAPGLSRLQADEKTTLPAWA